MTRRIARLLSTSLLAASLVGGSTSAWAKFTPPPAPTGHVLTTGGWLSPADQRTINDEADTIHTQTGFVVDVFLVGDLGGDSIEDVANATFQAWKIGDSGKDNGILLVVAPNFDKGQRKVRLLEGKGVQQALTAAEAREILQGIIEPRVNGDDVRAAVAAGLAAIAGALQHGDAGAPGATTVAADGGGAVASAPMSASSGSSSSGDGGIGSYVIYAGVGIAIIGGFLFLSRKKTD